MTAQAIDAALTTMAIGMIAAAFLAVGFILGIAFGETAGVCARCADRPEVDCPDHKGDNA